LPGLTRQSIRFGKMAYWIYILASKPGGTLAAALQREKNIKHWSREWKIDLIAANNPDWRDLYEEIVR
jgi:predicted GIY-YIG superfamily endonuclease